jgi:hypothetical protein
MIVCKVDELGEVLTMSYGQHVDVEDMRRCLGTVRDLMDQLKPGFLLMTDLSNLESMDAACAPELGAVMDLCSAGGMLTEVRVIPDPSKDIGFILISRFHHNPPVDTQTHASLAEAINSLRTETLPEAPLPAEPAAILLGNGIAVVSDGDSAEAQFAMAAGMAAEVNEGGLVDPEEA